jgi:hypothetical protein
MFRFNNHRQGANYMYFTKVTIKCTVQSKCKKSLKNFFKISLFKKFFKISLSQSPFSGPCPSSKIY